MKKFNECRSLYVGGPISIGGTLSATEVEVNLVKFFTMEARLQCLGYAVFNPARLPKHNRLGTKATQWDYLEQCFWMVMQADGIVVLNKWEQSPGTLREVLMAQSAGKPVFDEEFVPIGFTTKVILEITQPLTCGTV